MIGAIGEGKALGGTAPHDGRVGRPYVNEVVLLRANPGASQAKPPFGWPIGPTLAGTTGAGSGGWHVIVACLFHDIGYVRGILNGDDAECYVIDANEKTVELPRGSSDAALLPYRVDRSKLYVLNRFAGHDLIDAERIADAIEYTRFPPTAGRDNTGNEEGRLVLAADLIGQIADPHYLRKTNALWREFKEAGVDNKAARPYVAGRSDELLSAILLGEHLSTHTGGNPLPKQHVERAPLARGPL
jgi:hypothetical protein